MADVCFIILFFLPCSADLARLIEQSGGRIIETLEDIEVFPNCPAVNADRNNSANNSYNASSRQSGSVSGNPSTSSPEPWLIAVGNPCKFRRQKYIMALAKGEFVWMCARLSVCLFLLFLQKYSHLFVCVARSAYSSLQLGARLHLPPQPEPEPSHQGTWRLRITCFHPATTPQRRGVCWRRRGRAEPGIAPSGGIHPPLGRLFSSLLLHIRRLCALCGDSRLCGGTQLSG
jgi:hypothetical protein